MFLLEYLINLNDSLLIKNPELCFLYKAHMYPSDNVDGVSDQHFYEVRKVRSVEILQPAASFCWISWSSNSFRPIHPWSAVHSPASCCLLPAASRLQLKSSTASAVRCPPQSLEGFFFPSVDYFTSWPTCCRDTYSRRPFAAPLPGTGGGVKPAERPGRKLRVEQRHWNYDSIDKQSRNTKRELLPAVL